MIPSPPTTAGPRYQHGMEPFSLEVLRSSEEPWVGRSSEHIEPRTDRRNGRDIDLWPVSGYPGRVHFSETARRFTP